MKSNFYLKENSFNFSGLDKNKYTLVYYRDLAFTRKADNPDLAVVTISDPDKAREMATCHRDEPFSEIPYVVRGANLWYVADVPFTYTTMTDRYLILADLLHDILEINHPERHLASFFFHWYQVSGFSKKYCGGLRKWAINLFP